MRIWANRRWSLASKRVLLWVTLAIGVVLIFFLISIHGFLAVSNPVGEGVLVVEAWIPAKALEESAMVFNSGRYRCLAIVGGPMQGSGSKSNDPSTWADLAVSRLEKLGFDTKKVVQINVPAVSSGRTLAGATAVKRWLGSSRISVCCVDVFTVGAHARKSWILERVGSFPDTRWATVIGSESSRDPRTLTIRGFGWHQELEVLDSISRESVTKLIAFFSSRIRFCDSHELGAKN